METLEQVARALQRALAQDELLRTARRGGGGQLGLLVMKFERIKVQMFQEPNHGRPHIHIDYGKFRHVASFALDDGDLLAGSLDNASTKVLRAFIEESRTQLETIWHELQEGGDAQAAVAELLGDAR